MQPPESTSEATRRSRADRGGLDEYRRKRDFARTAEPAGGPPAAAEAGAGRFVIQKHAASRLHFDLRLERDGVLKSWAVPKGPSLEPGEKRLAVQVEDHPLEYARFEGVIPEDEYGGGVVMVWDEGRWRERDPGARDDDRIDFVLEGRRLRGAWTLTRMSGPASEGGRNWLLVKRHDGPDEPSAPAAPPSPDDVSVVSGRTMERIAADRDAEWTRAGGGAERRGPAAAGDAGPSSPPRAPKAQLATATERVPDGDGWLHEIKFDGYRILARLEGDEVRLFTRNGKDWTARFPEIAVALTGVPAQDAVLDGEVVPLDPQGSSSFGRLQAALSGGDTRSLVYQAFDLLHLDGRDLRGEPLEERKRALRDLVERFGRRGPLRFSDHLEGMGPAFLERACEMGLEGIVCKRRDAPYEAGRRKSWLKAKCTRHEDLVIGGFTDPSGAREGFGALLLGAYDEGGQLVYAGKVGTGFGADELVRLHDRLRALETRRPPFARRPKGVRGVHWVRPELVAEVGFAEWTRDGRLRHASFRGLREDKEAGEIRLPPAGERAARSPAGTAGEVRGAAPAPGAAKAPAGGGGGGGGRRRRRKAKDEEEVAGVWLSSPDKILFPEQNVSKLALAHYYRDVARWVLPHARGRPLSLVRCPQGRARTCFFQKHPDEAMAKGVARVSIEEKEGAAPYLYVRELADLVALVQAGVLELHVWGSRVDDVERPDLLVFDLDPGPGAAWEALVRTARELRDRLADLGLASFPRTTGGKGLHLVVPLRPSAPWDEAKAFARAVAEAHAHDDPGLVTTNMAKAERKGRIFLDYLRNGRGATAIASYSTRSREGAPVAAPVRWDEVGPRLRPDRYHVGNVRRRLSSLRADPWDGFDEARRPLTADLLRRVGVR